uniref:Mitochondrial carrier homolog 2 n=1 Tax=Caligus rogercresseyi TaxID=217165 RepID=C1BMP2_CALRO|nr:Mitochondrial carrier homolog 2 [Caligus rogercresseyi]
MCRPSYRSVMSLFLSATPKPSSAVSPCSCSLLSSLRDGFLGLYRGLIPKLIELRISGIVSDQVKAYFDYNKLEGIPDEDLTPEERNSKKKNREKRLRSEKDDELLSDEERKQKYLDKVTKDISERALEIILTQPFHVITIRTIAQFVGGEDKYGILSSFKTLIEDNGILGFWSGLIPRVIGEVLTIGLSTFITYLVNKHVIKDKDLQRYSPMVAYLASSSLFYPFQVVSNTMAVSGSGLFAGYPPNMPLYCSWLDCWNHLRSLGQLKRGSSLFFRYYKGPTVIIGDKAMPISSAISVLE